MTRLPGPIAVIDVETTGFSPAKRDRVLEVAAVVLDPAGGIAREFVSLVNPNRDIGPTRVHGIVSEDVIGAPTFAEIAPMLLDVLAGTVAIAGHNVQFDRRFLEHEFSLARIVFPDCMEICSRRLAGGGSLANCCSLFGIPHEQPHCALDDARATALLLSRLIEDATGLFTGVEPLLAITWPAVQATTSQPLTRTGARQRKAGPPDYLQRLLNRVIEDPDACATDGAVLAYTSILDRILEDRHVSETESQELLDVAESWGLSADQIRAANRDYLNHLLVAALGDGFVSDAEKRDLLQVARLLGQDHARLDGLIADACDRLSRSTRPEPTPALESVESGTRVCFTGELLSTYRGSPLTREMAEALAREEGLEVMSSVTKKLNVLVVADPQSQSGKAKKARSYGVRIIHEPVFWRMLGVEVTY